MKYVQDNELGLNATYTEAVQPDMAAAAHQKAGHALHRHCKRDCYQAEEVREDSTIASIKTHATNPAGHAQLTGRQESRPE
jgi:hypothetical protein